MLLPIALLLDSRVGGLHTCCHEQAPHIFSSPLQLLNSPVVTIEIGGGQAWDGVYIQQKERQGWNVLRYL